MKQNQDSKVQISRTAPSDRYYTFLKVIWLVSFVLVGFCGYRLMDNIQLYLYLQEVKSENSSGTKSATGQEIPVGRLICIEGKPDFSNRASGQRENSKIIEALEKGLGLNGVVYGHLTFWHTEGSGEDSSTVTDREFQFFRPFFIEKDGKKFEVSTYPKRVFSFSKVSTKVPDAGLSDFSPPSTDVKILWFAPGELSVIGKYTKDEKGTGTIEGTAKYPLILSMLPRENLQKNIFYASLLELLIVLFFLFSFLLPWVSSNSSSQSWIGCVKNQFEKQPKKFFIFDLAGGPETSATKLFFMYITIAVITWFYADFRHSFNLDNVVSLFTLGYLFFMQVARGFEFFYVANAQDGKFYEVSRGFGPPIVRSICLLTQIRPMVDSETDSEGNQKHRLITIIPGEPALQISDNMIPEEQAEETVSEYKKFIKSPW